jgi:hypothetical protein
MKRGENSRKYPKWRTRAELVVSSRRAYSSTVGVGRIAPGGDGPHVDPQGRASLRHRSREQSGNIIVLVAVFVPLVILTCAIVIDVSYWWINAKKAQVAADACALAAAGDPGFPKPYNLDHCRFGAPQKDYVRTNLHLQVDPTQSIWHKSTKVIAPYKTDPKRVEATVELRVNTFFGTYVGLDYVDIERRAVAEREDVEGDYAIYSHSAGCPEDGTGESLRFNGENHWINGRVHSNGEYGINNGSDTATNDPFWAKKGTRVHCVSINPENSARFGGDGYSTGQTKPDTVPPQTWPAWWTPAQFGWTDSLDGADACSIKAKSILIKENGGNTTIEVDSPIGTLPQLNFPGNTITAAYTYCAWEKFTINRQNLVASMTVLSPEITVNENNQTLSPASGNMLFFTVPNIDSRQDGSFATGGNPDCHPVPAKKMTLNGNSHTWIGTIFSPCGRVVVNVGGASIGDPAFTGTILAYEVEVNAHDFYMYGKSDFGGTFQLALWE